MTARAPRRIVCDVQRIGPYRIVRTIAIGGMGEVYLAALERSGGFEKRVALKCVLPRLMADPRFVDLFEREARLAAALSHRHIVQIFDFGRDQGGDQGRAWLAMEYVHGVDLKAVLDRHDGPLPLGVAVEIGVACARALDYAHRARDARGRPLHLIHRDVSPQNVLLGFEGDIKLADFGLARAHRDPHEGGLQGKFAYMSPEQVDDAPLDARADQFSLGVVLYEMFSGARAFFGDDGAAAILERVRTGALRQPLADAAPALPDPIRHVIERALRHERTERFDSAGALADALTAAAARAGITPGEPPLGPWLRPQFPDRSVAPPPLAARALEATAAPRSTPAEATAAADAPIKTPTGPTEHTVDAGVPIALGAVDPLGRTPSQIDPTADDPRTTAVLSTGGDPDPSRAPDAAVAPPLPPGPSAAPPPPAPRRRPWPVALLLAAALGALIVWLVRPEDAPLDPTLDPTLDAAAQTARTTADATPLTPDAAALDAAALDAAALAAALDAAALDATLDAATLDAAALDAARIAARPTLRPAARPDASRPRPDASTRRPAPDPRRRVARPDRTPPPDATRPTPQPDAARPPPPDAGAPPPPAGPRARIFTPGARHTSAVPATDGWRPIDDRGLLVRVRDAPGPPVLLRIRAAGGRYDATVDARPWGRVLLGERDLGPTPAAAVPLEPGRQTLRVVGPDGGETLIRIEISR